MSWATTTLGDVATIERRGVTAAVIAPGTRYLGLENIERGGRIVSWQVAGEVPIASTKFAFDSGHVLYGKLRPNLGKIAVPDFDGVCSTDILPIRPGPRLERRYLRYYLAQQSMIDFAASRAAGANLPRLSPSVLESFEIPLPPIEEQRRIAAILDQADLLSAKRRQALAHLDDLTQSIFLDMFGDPVTNPRGMPLLTLSEWVGASSPITYGILKPGPDVQDGVPYVRVTDIQGGGIRHRGVRRTSREIDAEYRRSRLLTGDLLVSIRGHVGRVGIVPSELEGGNITQDSARLRVAPIAREYVAAALSTPGLANWMARRTKGAAVQGINLGDLRLLPLPIPSEVEMADFADRVSGVRRMSDRAADSASLAADLVAALHQSAFAGNL